MGVDCPMTAYSCSFDCSFLLIRLPYHAYSGPLLANSRPILAKSGRFESRDPCRPRAGFC